MEKTGEELTYAQGAPTSPAWTTPSPLFNELAFSLATEKLLGIEVPERAQWIRMLMCEINRLSSHLLFMATNGMDLGAVSMMLYGWREREEVLRFLEMVTGLRMNHNYIRPGGVAADLPDGWRDERHQDPRDPSRPPRRVRHVDDGPAHLARASAGRRCHHRRGGLALGTTGPILRSTGFAWDLRRDQPYLRYDEVDFDVIVGTYGDCFDRYAIRLAEIHESIRIVRQILEKMPTGDYRIQDKKVTPPPRARIDESMEALIHHFKIFTEGFKVPEGEAYAASNRPVASWAATSSPTAPPSRTACTSGDRAS
jgi:NADH-quinone oxidoreductase subunit D